MTDNHEKATNETQMNILNEKYKALELKYKELEEENKKILIKNQQEVERRKKIEEKYKILQVMYSKNVLTIQSFLENLNLPKNDVEEAVEEEYQNNKQLESMHYELEVTDKLFSNEKSQNQTINQQWTITTEDPFSPRKTTNTFWTSPEDNTQIRDFQEQDPEKKSLFTVRSANGDFSASQEEIDVEDEEDDDEVVTKLDVVNLKPRKSWAEALQKEFEIGKLQEYRLREAENQKEENEILAKKLGGQGQKPTDISTRVVNKIKMGIELSLKSSVKMKDKQRKFKVFDNIEKRDFEFRDYSPEIFADLRKLAKVSDSEYLKSICEGNIKIIVTPGKSGAILFFTGDRKFILKSVSDTELKFLQTIAPKYYQHNLKHPHTLICRILGLYTIKNSSYQLHFIAMENVFPVPPQETYDLKGSSIGRFATEEEKKKHFFKDNDFLIKKTKISIIQGNKEEFIQVLKDDCAFLSSLEIMDYSILLGVSKVKENDWFNEDSKTRFTCFKSADGKFKYNLGVIDILQKWNLKKIAEMGLKSVVQEKKGLSSVPPKEYSQRFLDFIISSIVSPQDYILI